MRHIHLIAVLPLMMAASCDLVLTPEGRQGSIKVRFEETSVPPTRASSVPDTNGFLLAVTDSKGNYIYNGTYGASPENILADPGTYTVSARSCEFNEPAFDRPQYGDSQVVAVKSGETSVATLTCTQLNCGVRLKIDQAFLTEYPSASLFLKSAAGKLLYSYTEKRIAYFLPGTVAVVMSQGGVDKTIFSRSLQAQQMLSLGVSVSSNGGTKGNIEIQVDTTRNWIDDSFVIGGGGNAGSGTDNALSVGTARERAATGLDDVWVYGYIVGGDLSSSKCSFAAPFISRTNIVLATKSSTRDRDACISVQLAKGDIRDALNLVDHPELLGRQVFLRGDLVPAYYGLPGVQNISEYQLK